MPLEGLLAKYEEGMKLAQVCQEKLAEAELKIQQLEKSASGEMKLNVWLRTLISAIVGSILGMWHDTHSLPGLSAR